MRRSQSRFLIRPTMNTVGCPTRGTARWRSGPSNTSSTMKTPPRSTNWTSFPSPRSRRTSHTRTGPSPANIQKGECRTGAVHAGPRPSPRPTTPTSCTPTRLSWRGLTLAARRRDTSVAHSGSRMTLVSSVLGWTVRRRGAAVGEIAAPAFGSRPRSTRGGSGLLVPGMQNLNGLTGLGNR